MTWVQFICPYVGSHFIYASLMFKGFGLEFRGVSFMTVTECSERPGFLRTLSPISISRLDSANVVVVGKEREVASYYHYRTQLSFRKTACHLQLLLLFLLLLSLEYILYSIVNLGFVPSFGNIH
jgi:hypothetical protein